MPFFAGAARMLGGHGDSENHSGDRRSREREAQRRDVPKRWILGDESIVEIARPVGVVAAITPSTSSERRPPMLVRTVPATILRSSASAG